MDCMRINCAHDGPEAWAAMVRNLRDAERDLGKRCTVLMDLGGPKLRTGPISGPEVVRCRPRRDEWGRVITPARIWLTATEGWTERPDADITLPLPQTFLAHAEAGDRITFRDTRSARRAITITAVEPDGCWAETEKTCYIGAHTPVRLRKARDGSGKSRAARVGTLMGANPAIRLKVGDTLRVTRASLPGHEATRDDDGTSASPATIGCTLPEIFADVRPGEHIWFDDGKIGGVIRTVHPEWLDVEIVHARPAGSPLRADKGINLPDSDLHVPALTAKDLEDLDSVCALADMVGLSFVGTAEDVALLQRLLAERGAARLGIVLKLETRRAFAQLPRLLLQAMHSDAVGVMIARGDLAVESGFERLAEVQEEILWVCEAAHLPAIWATQVLETLAATGLSTRAEITDAAMGVRAECVMLNKGPYIVSAIRTLDDILQRMQGHRRKRVALLRQLRAWSTSLGEDGPQSHDE
jgi:pyruvate kinase